MPISVFVFNTLHHLLSFKNNPDNVVWETVENSEAIGAKEANASEDFLRVMQCYVFVSFFFLQWNQIF